MSEAMMADGKSTFEASIKASLLRDSLDTIAQLISEGTIRVTESGLSLDAVDRSMVAFVSLHIHKEAFESFCASGENSLNVNLENLLSVIKRAKGDDNIILALKDGKLLIKVEGEYSRQFSMPLLETQQGEKVDIDKLRPPARLQLKSSFLQDGVEDAGIISDHIVLEASPATFLMRSEGNGSKMEINVGKGNAALSIDAKESVRSSFSLEYLKKMMKGSKISDVVSLELGKDYPMKLEFRQPDKIRLSFVLAPRVED